MKFQLLVLHLMVGLSIQLFLPIGCPTDMFGFPGSTECFKFRSGSWSEGKKGCESEGLVFAHPSDDIALRLRNHIVDTIDDTTIIYQKYNITDINAAGESFTWVGARGTGHSMAWLEDDSAVTPNLIWPDPYRSITDTHKCLGLAATKRHQDGNPEFPFGPADCKERFRVLCQGCPTDMFNLPGSTECFKFRRGSRAEGTSLCKLEGLVFARPSDAIALRLGNYIVETYGEGFTWVGANGTGTGHNMAWLENDPVVTPNLVLCQGYNRNFRIWG